MHSLEKKRSGEVWRDKVVDGETENANKLKASVHVCPREQVEGVQRYLAATDWSLYSSRSLQRARSQVSVRHVSFQH